MENKNLIKYEKPTYLNEDVVTTDILSYSNGTTVEKSEEGGLGILSAAMSYILGY